MMPVPTPPAGDEPRGSAGLLTSVNAVLRLVLSRVDPDRATAEQVRDALYQAGVSVSLGWASDWLHRARGLRSVDPDA